MVSIRMSEEDEKLIRDYARYNRLTVSEFMRQAAIDHIEDEYDRKIIEDYERRKATGEIKYYSHEDAWTALEGE